VEVAGHAAAEQAEDLSGVLGPNEIGVSDHEHRRRRDRPQDLGRPALERQIQLLDQGGPAVGIGRACAARCLATATRKQATTPPTRAIAIRTDT
jgi:hypothetical protein